MKKKTLLLHLSQKLIRYTLIIPLLYSLSGAAQTINNTNSPIDNTYQPASSNTTLPILCGTDLIREKSLKQNPLTKEEYSQSIKKIQQYISNKENNKSENSQYRIPVVIHVIHNGEPIGTGTNISDIQIQSQIDKLNSAFDNIGGGTNSVPTDISFCLAQKGPNSSTVTWIGLPGVNRIQDTQTNTGVSNLLQTNLMNTINWPSDQYLNIWLVSTINGSTTGVIGYSPQPLTNGILDGVVIQTNVFGDNTTGDTYNLLPGYDLGMTMVHEAGHYLGLFHTFQGASCNEVDCSTDGDMICDTPPTKIGSTCSTPICNGAQIENYMDYTFDNCKNTYTLGQKNWMEGTINTMRTNLISPENLTLTGVPCAPAGLIASFTNSQSQICKSATVNFTATTTNNTATTFSWTFSGGTPNSATGPGPHTVNYNAPGDFNIILETNDGINNLINTSTNAINVTDCGAGIDGPQTQWQFPVNCALDFSSGVPVGFSGSNDRGEGAASISDINGDLIFYTDGYRAWNSSGLITNSLRTVNNSESPAQGAVIVPDPNNSDNYYVFNTPAAEGITSKKIRYSLYEGNTQDFPTIINQTPITNYEVTEHIAAAPHCNGTDYWVIYHGLETGVSDKFLAYQVSANGVSSTPIISDAFPLPQPHIARDLVGQIDIAPNGRLMAATYFSFNSISIFIYEINRANGEIEFLSSVPFKTLGYSISFSPNSEFLYTVKGTELRQYKISEILTCEGEIAYNSLTISSPSLHTNRSLQAGPDGKIYITRQNEQWLDVINYPNKEITTTDPNSIGYNDYAVFIPNNRRNRFSLPNMIDVPLGLSDANFDYCITNCNEVEFHNLSCGDQFSWDFGDTNNSITENPTHVYTNPGTYTVTLTLSTTLATGNNNTSIFTKTININTLPPTNITGPNSINCPTPVNQFSQYSPDTIDPNLEYHWTVTGGNIVGANPSNVAYIDWINSGSIQVLAVDPISGCSKLSESIDVTCNTLSLNSFEENNLMVYPNPTDTGLINIHSKSNKTINITVYDPLGKLVIQKHTNTNTLNLSHLSKGLYFLKIAQDDNLIIKKILITK